MTQKPPQPAFVGVDGSVLTAKAEPPTTRGAMSGSLLERTFAAPASGANPVTGLALRYAHHADGPALLEAPGAEEVNAEMTHVANS
jgi:hypothetical protein